MTYQRQRTADGSDTLYSVAAGQGFHSAFGALTETHHVFIEGSGLDRRLAAGLASRVLEIGFGTGLNFFATAMLARQSGAALAYLALENSLVAAELLSQLNHDQLFAGGADLRQAFIAWRAALPDPLPLRLSWRYDGQISLELLLADASTVEIPSPAYHAIYHDPFSPEVNPTLWTPTMFSRLHAVLADGGRLATYSVKGTVRRALQTAGFQVQKRPGPPGKREVLVATRSGSIDSTGIG
jgi:tRNA U34 5-methylaminomethyl-2-thiouridine-forming methyltransferase MnmC